jgi:glycosyltransferase involved in cell wall biosynthesis
MPYRITILLPGSGHTPLGGYRVAYEYANRLAARGHDVTTVHPAILYRNTSVAQTPKKLVRYLQRRLDGSYHPKHWFDVDPRVKLEWVPSLHHRYIPSGDLVMATAWQTAEWLDDYPMEVGKKICLVYDFEHFMGGSPATRKRMAAVFGQRMKAIATSPAVFEMLSACGASDTAYIPNGLDFEVFRPDNGLSDPLRCAIGFPTRNEPFKGTKDAIKALSMVREQFNRNLRFWSFGGRRPSYIPEWVEYHEQPTDQELRRLYDQTSIFTVPSHYEGWGLPGAEAMCCGAALASTDNGGVRAYAQHARNALLSPPNEPKALAENVLQLLRDSNLRVSLAEQALLDIRRFTWRKAVDALERLIEGLCLGTASQQSAMRERQTSITEAIQERL